MLYCKIAAVTVLFAGASILAAGAQEAANSEEAAGTGIQHHTWSQKFYMAPDPDVTGSLAPPMRTTTDLNRTECVPRGLGFSNPPLAQWRIDAC